MGVENTKERLVGAAAVLFTSAVVSAPENPVNASSIEQTTSNEPNLALIDNREQLSTGEKTKLELSKYNLFIPDRKQTQLESDPPVVNQPFPLLNQRLSETNQPVDLSNMNEVDQLINSPLFKTHIDTQIQIAGYLRTFKIFGGTPMNPVPYENFEAVSAITNTEFGPIVAGGIRDTKKGIVYLYNQNATENSAYIYFPEGSKLGFSAQTKGAYKRIVPTMIFEDGTEVVLTEDFTPALNGKTTNPGLQNEGAYTNLEEVPIVIATQLHAPTAEMTGESLAEELEIKETQVAEVVENGAGIELKKAAPPEIAPTEPAGGVMLTKNFSGEDNEIPGYKLATPEGPIEVRMQKAFLGSSDPENNKPRDEFSNPDLGIYDAHRREPGEPSYYISGVVVDHDLTKITLPKYGNPNQSIEVSVFEITLAIPISDTKTIFVKAYNPNFFGETDLMISGNGGDIGFREYDSFKNAMEKGINVVLYSYVPHPVEGIEAAAIEKLGSCNEICEQSQAFYNQFSGSTNTLEDLYTNGFDSLENGDTISVLFNAVISSPVAQAANG